MNTRDKHIRDQLRGTWRVNAALANLTKNTLCRKAIMGVEGGMVISHVWILRKQHVISILEVLHGVLYLRVEAHSNG